MPMELNPQQTQKPGTFRRFAQMVGVVGRERFRPVEERVYARFRQHGHPRHCLFQNGFEMVEIFRQLVEAEIVGNVVQTPRLGVRLEGPEQHLARVFLVVGALVRHPQHRQAFEAVDGFGDDVEMLAGMERHGCADHLPDRMAPHARAVHDDVGLDVAGFIAAVCRPVDAGNLFDAAMVGGGGNVVHLHAFANDGTPHPRALRERQVRCWTGRPARPAADRPRLSCLRY